MSGSPASIHLRGRAALLAGAELLDLPPVPGGPRWGLSLVVRPDAAGAARLAALAAEAAALAGPGQWVTGARESSHLTVTYLEPVHRDVGPDDQEVRRFAEVVARIAAATPPLRWAITGLALADRGVLALAAPVDPAPDAFRSAVLDQLEELGRAEAHYRRTVWWSTLLHFAAPVADRAGLAAWVDDRVGSVYGAVQSEVAEIVRYQHDGSRTAPVTLAAAPLTGVRGGAPGGAHA